MHKEDRENWLEIRKCFQRVFSSHDGYIVLSMILNQCGYFSMDPKQINPETIAIANQILFHLGITHALNLQKFAEAIMGIANNKDLEILEKEES